MPWIKGAGGYDCHAVGGNGANELWEMIYQDPEKFQAIRSLYVEIGVQGFDDFEDDQWATALEAIRPGNNAHNIESIKIQVTGNDWFEPHSKYSSTSQFSKNVSWYKAERAFVKALLNIRNVQRVEVNGPMPAGLKKMIAAAMTTRAGEKMRKFEGASPGLRSDIEIGLGMWVATMQPADGDGPVARTRSTRMTPFHHHTFLPVQEVEHDPNRKILEFASDVERDISTKPFTPSAAASDTTSSLDSDNDVDFSPFELQPRVGFRTMGKRGVAKKKQCRCPTEPSGRIVRINVPRQDLGDFGVGANPLHFMPWFKGEKEWLLPADKGAKVTVATRIDANINLEGEDDDAEMADGEEDGGGESEESDDDDGFEGEEESVEDGDDEDEDYDNAKDW